MLHHPDIQYGFRFGIDLDEFCSSFDPLLPFRAYHQAASLSRLGFVTTSRVQTAACHARSLCHPVSSVFHAVPSVGLLHSQREISDVESEAYPAQGDHSVPIVIDTGASMSITPFLSDFDSAPEDSPVPDLITGLAHKTTIAGVGRVSWLIDDMYGVRRRISTNAYYVPDAKIRLYSPQSHFQESSET